ncbi:ABC transporter permease [Rhodoferax sp.]|uniref:ABC transporter permease n=1 Tax=Rhodoferax sp. TaxID=50421 RepID=UPI00261486DC|nr:ABC transporter permease [Rhodoferax sp.]MDD5478444.1 ABC transporter permease [Rhodoferax sp.]
MILKLWQYRGFIVHSLLQEFRARYAGSAFGMLWAVINPFVQILVYTLVFAHVMRARMPGQAEDVLGYSIYLCAGLIPWTCFAEIVARSTNMFIEHGNLIKKSAFPRVCLPVIVLFSSLINFAILLGIFLLFMLLVGRLSWSAFFLCIPLSLLMILPAVGLGLALGTLNVFFRDVHQVQGILLQFWFWLTPIVWPVEALPPALRSWLPLNPLEPMVNAMHSLFLGSGNLDTMGLLRGALFAVVTLWIGYAMFRSRASEFADEL